MNYFHVPSPGGDSGRRRNILISSLLFLASAAVFWLNYSYALHGWFYREDSRYFSNGLFSPYDIFCAFLAPHNNMGHYRPITKLIWGIPRWLGPLDAGIYHLISFSLLAAAAIMLMRLSYLLFRNPPLAVLAGILWALMPTNAKPVYWICACQDPAAALFVFSACVFRLEQWMRPESAPVFRRLCLLSVILALFCREAAYSTIPLLLVIDWRYGQLRKSWDVARIWIVFVLWVFVLNPPFDRARVGVKPSLLFSFSLPEELWNYARSAFWTFGDADLIIYPWWAIAVTALAITGALVAPFFCWQFLFTSLFALAGIAPFLLIHAFSVEYAFLFGAGISLLLTGIPAALLRQKLLGIPAQLALLTIGLTLIGGYYQYLGENREIFASNYTDRSLLLKNFLSELNRFTHGLPAYQRIELVDIGPYRNSEARDSNHFIPVGLDELIPDRVILIAPAVLNSGEGTNWRDPHSRLWQTARDFLPKPVQIHYTDKGFSLD